MHAQPNTRRSRSWALIETFGRCLGAWRSLSVAIALPLTLAVASCGGGADNSEPGADSRVLNALTAAAPPAASAGRRHAAAGNEGDAVDAIDAALQLLDFGEVSFPTIFTGKQTNRFIDDWVYRYYPSTQVYLAVIGGNVLAFGGPFGPEVRHYGALTTYITPRRMRPVADAGAAQSVVVNTLATLNGSGSTDPDGDQITYRWSLTRKPDGSNAQLVNPTSPLPSLTPDVIGSYEATLVVNDKRLDSLPAKVTITAAAANAAPVANAGPNQSVGVGSLVVLNGSASSDADGDPLSYAWEIASRPSGSTTQLGGAGTSLAQFRPDVAGSYQVRLVVSDGKVASAPAVVTITAAVVNAAPVANAGSAQSVTTGSTVALNGAQSSDANGDPLTYSWTFTSRPAGSAATLISATTATPLFVADVAGVYVVSLVVSDGQLSSNAATVTITATTPVISRDGTWNGTNSQGRSFSFVVVDGRISKISVSYAAPGCPGTTTTESTFTPPLSAISGNSIAMTFPAAPFRAMSGSFPTANTAAGSVTIEHRDNAFFCFVTFTLNWSASKP